MKFTNFKKLQLVVKELGASPVIAKLEKQLTGEGVPVAENSERIVIGEGGIYQIDPSGLLTKVVIHIVDKNIHSKYAIHLRELVVNQQFDSPQLVKDVHKYHLVKCKTIERAENEGWRKDRYRMSRRTDGSFFYRYLDSNSVLAEKEDQKLNVCKNCLSEINSLAVHTYSVSDFDLKLFLSSEFEIITPLVRQGEYADMCVPNLYKSDWSEISRKYRSLKEYQCESLDCPHPDLSETKFHKFLHTHHASLNKTNNDYLNLKAYCIYCHAHQPNHSQLLSSPDYKTYINLRGISFEQSRTS